MESISDQEVITQESTTYPILKGVKRWIQPLKIDYEGFYTLIQRWRDKTGNAC